MDDSLELLGGAKRRATRVRGFAPWRPQDAAVTLLAQVHAVLEEYREHLPLTCRQVFYRLVGAHGYEKTERAHERLCEILNRARRSGLVSMDMIRDDGRARVGGDGWASANAFLDAVRQEAARLRLDRSQGQRVHLALMYEAAGMVPQFARVAADYGLPVFSSGGFDSVTEKHRLAKQLAGDRRPAEILHVGDHDPSGAHIFLALAEDVVAFGATFGVEVRFTRVAVVPKQIDALELPTAPPKPTDRRAFAGETSQAEAIPPDVLAQIVRGEIDARIDDVALRRVLAAEQDARRVLLGKLEK